MFQEVDGETEERRRARLERHQRTQERAVCAPCYMCHLSFLSLHFLLLASFGLLMNLHIQAKALAEKNQRDLQVQREQAERHVSG